MGDALADVVVNLRADFSDLTTGLKQAQSQTEDFVDLTKDLSDRLKDMIGDTPLRRIEEFGKGVTGAKYNVEDFMKAFETDVLDKFGADAQTAAEKAAALAKQQEDAAAASRTLDEALGLVSDKDIGESLDKGAEGAENLARSLDDTTAALGNTAKAGEDLKTAVGPEAVEGGTEALNQFQDAAAQMGTALEQAAERARAAYDELKASGTATDEELLRAWIDMEDKRMAAAVEAGEKISNTEAKALDDAKARLAEMTHALPSVEEAFATLGVKSSEQLQKFADVAQRAYQAIAESGTASAEDIQRAWVKAEEARQEAARATGAIVSESEKEVLAQAEAAVMAIDREAGAVHRAAQEIASAVTEATKFGADVDAAFRELGVKSSAELQETANAAKEAFDTITQNALVSDRDRLESWVAAEEARQEAALAAGEAISEADRAQLEAAKEYLHEAGDAAKEASEGLKEFGEKLLAIGEALVITEGLKEFGEEALGASDYIQRMTNSLAALSGSTAAANRLLEESEEIMQKHPFSDEELLEATRKLVIYNVEITKIPGILEAIANDSRATGKSFETISSSLERIASMGQVANRQLRSLGVSFEDIAKTAGMSMTQVQELLKKGGQDAAKDLDLVLKTIQEKFGKMSEIPLTLSEQWKIVKNQMHEVFVGIGTAITPVIQAIVSLIKDQLMPALRWMVDSFNELPAPIKNTAVAIGLMVAAIAPLSLAIGGFMTAVAGAKTGLKLMEAALAEYNIKAAAATAQTEALSGAMAQAGITSGAANATASVGLLSRTLTTFVPIAIAAGGAIAGIRLTETDTAFAHLANTIKVTAPGMKDFAEGAIDAATATVESAAKYVHLDDTVHALGESFKVVGGTFITATKTIVDSGAQIVKGLSWKDALFPQFAGVRDFVNGISDGLEALSGQSEEMSAKIVESLNRIATAAHGVTTAGDDFKAAWDLSRMQAEIHNVGATITKFVTGQREAQTELTKAKQVFDAVTLSYKTGKEMANGYVATQSDLKIATEAYHSALKKVHPEMEQSLIDAGENVKSAGQLVDAHKALEIAVSKARQTVQQMNAQVAAGVAPASALRAAKEQLKKAEDELAGAWKSNIISAEELLDKQTYLDAEVVRAQAVYDALKDAFYRTGEGAEALKKAEEQLDAAQKAAAGSTKEWIDYYNEAIKKIGQAEDAAEQLYKAWREAAKNYGKDSREAATLWDQLQSKLKESGRTITDVMTTVGVKMVEMVQGGKIIQQAVTVPIAAATGAFSKLAAAPAQYTAAAAATLPGATAAVNTHVISPINVALQAWLDLQKQPAVYQARVAAAAREAIESMNNSLVQISAQWDNLRSKPPEYLAAITGVVGSIADVMIAPFDKVEARWQALELIPSKLADTIQQTSAAISADMVAALDEPIWHWEDLDHKPEEYLAAVRKAMGPVLESILFPTNEALKKWGLLEEEPAKLEAEAKEHMSAAADEIKESWNTVDKALDAYSAKATTALTEPPKEAVRVYEWMAERQKAVIDDVSYYVDEHMSSFADTLTEGWNEATAAAQETGATFAAAADKAEAAFKQASEAPKLITVNAKTAAGDTAVAFINAGDKIEKKFQEVSVEIGSKVKDAASAAGVSISTTLENAIAKPMLAAGQQAEALMREVQGSIEKTTYQLAGTNKEVEVYVGNIHEGKKGWDANTAAAGETTEQVRKLHGAVNDTDAAIDGMANSLHKATAAASELTQALDAAADAAAQARANYEAMEANDPNSWNNWYPGKATSGPLLSLDLIAAAMAGTPYGGGRGAFGGYNVVGGPEGSTVIAGTWPGGKGKEEEGATEPTGTGAAKPTSSYPFPTTVSLDSDQLDEILDAYWNYGKTGTANVPASVLKEADITEWLKQITAQINQYVTEGVPWDTLEGYAKGLNLSLEKLDDGTVRVTRAMRDFGGATAAVSEDMPKEAQKVWDMIAAGYTRSEIEDEMKNAGYAVHWLADGSVELDAIIDNLGSTVSSASDAFAGVSGSISDFGDALDGASAAAQESALAFSVARDAIIEQMNALPHGITEPNVTETYEGMDEVEAIKKQLAAMNQGGIMGPNPGETNEQFFKRMEDSGWNAWAEEQGRLRKQLLEALDEAYQKVRKVTTWDDPLAGSARAYADLQRQLDELYKKYAGSSGSTGSTSYTPPMGTPTVLPPGTREPYPLPTVPHLAEGGVVTRGTVAEVAENGPEAVIPLERFKDLPTGDDVREISRLLYNARAQGIPKGSPSAQPIEPKTFNFNAPITFASRADFEPFVDLLRERL